MSFDFLELDDLLKIHHDQIKRYGGFEGVRAMELLQSAIAMPQAGAGDTYFHKDVFEMAAAYLFHIINNHPFIDGNKRTGAMSAIVFLKLNGYALRAPEKAYENLVMSVAAGKTGKVKITEFFKNHSE
ncbi:MAG: type II toxin-antitoxin system death-on-curing family toxin [Nitrospinota bacterium]